MTKRLTKATCSAAFALLALTGGGAPSICSAAEPSSAQALFDEGRKLVLQKRYGEACPKLAESLRLENGIGTMLYLADCYEKNGQTAGAWVHFKAAAKLANETKDERESVARRRAASLESELTRIIIMIPRDRMTPNMEILCDGVHVNEEDFGGPLPVAPGVHTVTAKAPNRESWTATLTIPKAPGASVTVNVPLLDESKPAAAATVAATATPTQTARPTTSITPPPSSGSAMRIAGVSLGIAGLASIGAGTLFGLQAKSLYASSNEDNHCTADSRCDAEGKRDRADANSSATMSTIFVAAGAGSLAGGIVLYLLAPSAAASTAIAPSVGPHNASVSLMRRF